MLKNTIDTTNELKNKVKLANTRIKETVIRGGYDFKSLDKAPERIKKMLGNYKKIAMGNVNFSINRSTNADNNIFMNLEFKPSKIFLKFENSNTSGAKTERYKVIDDTNITTFYEYFYFGVSERTRIFFSVKEYTKTTLKFRAYEDWGDSYSHQLKITKWIAVE